MQTLDEARAAQPAFAMALYALEPGGPVTLEIITPDGEPFTFEGPTEAAVLARAFPPVEAAPPPPEADIFA